MKTGNTVDGHYQLNFGYLEVEAVEADIMNQVAVVEAEMGIAAVADAAVVGDVDIDD